QLGADRRDRRRLAPHSRLRLGRQRPGPLARAIARKQLGRGLEGAVTDDARIAADREDTVAVAGAVGVEVRRRAKAAPNVERRTDAPCAAVGIEELRDVAERGIRAATEGDRQLRRLLAQDLIVEVSDGDR